MKHIGIKYDVRQESERCDDMQQFIRYLYEYNEGRRIRNIGFVKVENQDDKCTMHIHGKGVDFGGEKMMEVLVFYAWGEDSILVSQGSVESATSVIHFILRFDAQDMGGQSEFDAVQGVVLRNAKGKNYVAVWDDTEVDVGRMITREEWEERHAMEAEAVAVCEEAQPVRGEAQEPVRAEAVCEEQSDEVEEYIPPKGRTYEKIKRQDLARLPRKEWRLANNSFLLHGFYNYHHLLYIEEGENCWIGVPGIYHEKESAAARAFGFPQFHRITDGTLELSEEETDRYEDFGYWCRAVSKA